MSLGVLDELFVSSLQVALYVVLLRGPIVAVRTAKRPLSRVRPQVDGQLRWRVAQLAAELAAVGHVVGWRLCGEGREVGSLARCCCSCVGHVQAGHGLRHQPQGHAASVAAHALQETKQARVKHSLSLSIVCCVHT